MALHFENSLVVCADFIERFARCDRIDHNEAFGSAQVLFADSPEKWKLRAGIEPAPWDWGTRNIESHSRVFLLPCRFEHIKKCRLTVDNTPPQAIWTHKFDSGFWAKQKHAIDLPSRCSSTLSPTMNVVANSAFSTPGSIRK